MRRTVPLLAALALAVTGTVVLAPPASAAPPSRPGIVVGPLGTGAGCIIQSTFGTELGRPGNLEAVVQQGNELVHYWRPNNETSLVWRRGQVVSRAATGPGCIIQTSFGTELGRPGNLEVVVREGSRLTHYFHDSTQPASPWIAGQSFGTGVTGAPSVIQSDFRTGTHGNLEVVVPEGTNLVHWWHDSSTPTSPWQRGGTVATGITAGGTIIQSDFRSGTHGNFEVAVAEGDHVAHFWKDNRVASNPWNRGQTFATGVTGAPSLIQSTFPSASGHRNFEVAVRQGARLVHWWHDNTSATSPWRQGQTILASGASSDPSLIQSTLGLGIGNFELVALAEHPAPPPDTRVRDGVQDFNLVHFFHENRAVTTPWRRAQTVTYRGRSEKVCQLTGGVDKESGYTTTNDTAGRANFGFTDIGYPVDDGTTLKMYFGDSRDRNNFGLLNEAGFDDAVGISTDTTPPSITQCLRMSMATGANGAWSPLRVDALPSPPSRRFYQGLFNVPESGFTVGAQGYTFFISNHCAWPRGTSCDWPAAPDTDARGRSALTRNTGDATFRELYSMPAPYNVVTAALNTDLVTGIPASQKLGVYAFGIDLYRGGNPRLAFVPAGSVETPGAWRYLRSVDAAGAPVWDTDPARSAPLFTTGDPAPGCVGEMHVSFVAPLNRWLMLYNCVDAGGEGNVKARVAPAPWGPWSAPTEIFQGGTDGGWCRYMHRVAMPACDHLEGDNFADKGDPYGPYVLTRFTRPVPEGAEITFLMSTWDPYQVVVMRATITASP